MTSIQTSVDAMNDKIALIDKWCSAARILPVITIEREADILPLADALAAGGLRVLEITLRSAQGLGAIRLLREQRPELIVGAGTVLDANMLEQAEAAGAQFIVSPGSTPALLEAALQGSLPLLPGVASASEIMLGYAMGYRRFKLFPAEICGGVAALKALGGPFGDIRFCPTGGVNARNARDYLALTSVMCVGGTWMVDAKAVRAGDWAAIESATRQALQALDSAPAVELPRDFDLRAERAEQREL
ncbi:MULTISPECIES: bifunctional 4-hydroxy-2-oxoglutarate aldolase/2-dehydro-3-deoxy-phosphogluconate aldolase [Stutzerimonas stutzeri subgroup]|uniref:2-dehydro-3-deoxy-phosphogluconate aldolase n=1 Tax=Stutzerimonas stutzeri NF13 TaxID=1212548 RepID=M2TUB7_STUST|nr:MULTISPECIES: bifunctional 4-hydroxy-2-oxoglutarate aldolase/2-dehydro-3-deoxy-phosphogluconate aldolase [Stutzerimonas stutzeri subgroup]MBU0919644.1 bifunctional 4-hydroxy-2-oxoglutarate aldolase/2-dehydro-3-deoxy-phosphogluconate aldolase [Gammaproteobacteria bacterium]WOF78640.1 bifunctional 4-hydroxy-2-oxoglutarate aldolase/2-dehydro-3-deoxy-phosphogluconate aldolase [Pseudomonas sp. FeN3W]EME00921.1 keto-hydroxyglutarate-aldolase/keto-deoxy-phosphogluconate aldolase [Stutzerimonas stutz